MITIEKNYKKTTLIPMYDYLFIPCKFEFFILYSPILNFYRLILAWHEPHSSYDISSSSTSLLSSSDESTNPKLEDRNEESQRRIFFDLRDSADG